MICVAKSRHGKVFKHDTLQYYIVTLLNNTFSQKTFWSRISNCFSYLQVSNEIFNPRRVFLEKYYFPSGALCCYLSWIMRGLILSQTPGPFVSAHFPGTNKPGNIGDFFVVFFFWFFLSLFLRAWLGVSRTKLFEYSENFSKGFGTNLFVV